MGLQAQFEEFNKKIKMDFDERAELATKRDILLGILKENKDLPSFEKFDQGSYAMFTGVEPLNKEYDIDVGLRFNINKADSDPIDIKKIIYDSLKNHTEYGAEIKKPCVTVKYKKNGELAYHVDLVAYSYEDKDNKGSQLYLARGTNNDNQEWEEADPLELIDLITNKFTDASERDQYRRIIRYLKRWKNIKFSSNGHAEPPSIGITLLAYDKFEPKEYDWVEMKFKDNDLEALINFVEKIKDLFVWVGKNDQNEDLYRLEFYLPVKPNTDVFSKMTDIQMTNFRNKIIELYNALLEVKDETDIIEQCKKLRKIFGDDFLVPEKENESKSQSNYIPPRSEAGAGTCDR